MVNLCLNWNVDGRVVPAVQKQFYAKNGFLLVRKCVPQHEIDRYRRRFQELCCNEAGLTSMTVMRDVSIAKEKFEKSENTITKIQDFVDDEVLFDYCKYRDVVDVVKDLIGTPQSNLMAMHTMLISKPPDTGTMTSRHPMHQDLHYFPFRPADFICCAWTAMEKVNCLNGCLVVIPGSHKSDLLPHEYPKWEGGVNKAYYGIQNYDSRMPRTYVEMEAGDTIFFHPLLIHGSGANRTKGFRKAISCHYANDDECHYVDVKGTIQEEVSKEIVEMAKKKMKKYGAADDIEITFTDLWRIRARPVGGTRCNL